MGVTPKTPKLGVGEQAHCRATSANKRSTEASPARSCLATARLRCVSMLVELTPLHALMLPSACPKPAALWAAIESLRAVGLGCGHPV